MMATISQKLKLLFKNLPIDVVYLYGSQANKQRDQFSDYDLGVLFKLGLDKKERFNLRLKLFSQIAKGLKVTEDKLDVVDLQAVPLLLQFNAISGKIVYCSNQDRRISFETYVMARYHDEHYYLDRYFEQTLEKIKKGVYFDRPIPYS